MKFYTTLQAAEVLGVTASRIRQLVLAGDLRGEKFGRDLMIDAAALKRYKKPRRGRPRASAAVK